MEAVQDHQFTMNLYHKQQQKLMNIGKDHEEEEEDMNNNVSSDNESTLSSSSSSFEESNISNESSSSSDLLDDATSSTSPNGPLFGLSELMDQLPIKRGLSKYYQGKSQSFTSLARVTSLEDLAKKENPYQKRLKACRSYGGGLNFKSFNQPKSTINKRVTKGSLSNLSCLSRNNSFMGSLPPLNPVQRTF
ncbi:uncharacterized protein LOC141611125 [Silene latifolia]|uniref:uncharacterized protein LOC141611125 n=1 Tax=Silene latifolia TaxID=37657 RepID=UPI003D777731